jgi:hypothetical protein
VSPLQHLRLSFCRAHAASRGGACTSDRYVTRDTKLSWRCALGHTWKASPRPVLTTGSWCPTCGHARRAQRTRAETFASIRAIALERGGECLSTRYPHSQAKLEFRCALDHRWSATAGSIAAGSWCGRCGDARAHVRVKEKKFKSVQAIARRHGGECLSTEYVNVFEKLRWRCAEGHEWEAASQQIGYGAWCPRCAGVARHTLEELQALAAERGGECLSEKYVQANVPMRWSCAAGHRWWATASNVIHQGNWCRRCHGAPRDELARLQQIAKRHGGDCLSREYAGSMREYLWRCRERHQWWTTAARVVKGSWCPTCRRARGPHPTLTLDDMLEVAADHGGECLSQEYVNQRTPLLWRCARGHEWEAVPHSVRGRGSWCPRCSHSVRGTIDGLRERARELGGQCLSSTYDDPRVPLVWQCARGHRFEALAKAVKSGVWCSTCARGPTPRKPPRPRGSGQHTRRRIASSRRADS